MKKIYFFIIFVMFVINVNSQILPEYRFYNQNLFLLNPACAGINSGISANLGHRIQWVGLKDAPENTYFTIDGLITNSMGIGFFVNRQSQGLLNISNLGLSYSYRIALGEKHTLGFGANINFVYNKIGSVGLSDYELADIALISNNFNSSILTSGAGLSYRFYELGVDISSPFLLSYQEKIFMQQLFTLVSYNFYSSNKTWRFQPSALINYSRKTPFEAELNFIVDWKTDVWGGITYNTSNKISLVVGFFVKYIGIGYAYNYSLKPVTYLNSVTHEIVLQFSTPYSLSKKKPLFIDSRNRNLFN